MSYRDTFNTSATYRKFSTFLAGLSSGAAGGILGGYVTHPSLSRLFTGLAVLAVGGGASLYCYKKASNLRKQALDECVQDMSPK